MKFLSHVVEKIQERSPLKFGIVCCASSISPITKLVDKRFDSKWLTARISDGSEKQMGAFLLAVTYELQYQFLEFTEKEPLAKFLSKSLHENDKYDCL